jgi:lysylphosphatidylglycerol synthetase-like protein (DUF2156 family)
MFAGMKNWKTTTAAIAAAVSAIAGAVVAITDSDPDTVANWSEVVPLVIFAVGLLFARDADKTSQSSGAK